MKGDPFDDLPVAEKIKRALRNARQRREAELAAMTPEERTLEDEKAAAFERRLQKADRADADADLVLVRIAIPRWSVIQWWLLDPAQRTKAGWRASIEERAAATTPPMAIRLALRDARSRSYPLPLPSALLARRVYVRSMKPSTIRDAMEARFSLDSRMRGEAREIAYEYTGKRLRQHLAFERRQLAQGEQP